MPKGETPQDTALNGALDELYSAPFDHFISLRRELVARLRTAGDSDAARHMGAANKPTRSAWALNQVARRRPELIAAIIESWDAAAAAQKTGDAEEIRDSARQYRDAVAQALQEVRSVLAADGASLSASQARRMGETLQALVSDVEERRKLQSGRLTRDIDVEDPFAGLETSDKSSRRAEPEDEADAARRRESERLRLERERAVDEARAKVSALEASVDLARTAAAEAERALRQAQSAAHQTKGTLTRLEQDLTLARDQLKRLS